MTLAVRDAFYNLAGRIRQSEFFVRQNLLRVIASVQLVTEFKSAFLEGW